MIPQIFLNKRRQLALLVVRQQAEPLATSSGLCQFGEAYQDDHVPKGSEAEPLAELVYGLQVP